MKKSLNNQYFILRHGRVDQQIKRKEFIYNWPDIPSVKLTKAGIDQIKKAAKILKKERIDLIYSSDIYRTRQTALIVANELGLKIKFDKRLRDINLGIYHGKLRKEFFQDFPLSIKRFTQRPTRGENWNDVKKRLSGFLKEVEKKHKNKNILIIGHGDPLWLLEGIIKGFSNGRLLRELSRGNYIKKGGLRKVV
ncbi:MAG: hypothetical protein A2Z78_01620 [Candidatus Nealsonbacteria bacterium RBG_13_36_15]|uniref:Phosphoglycerate mutase n=1 Tax=Candidatus Nealsonbacteria bacterium RBG_13_36_15 TaxID=1801660 RepID=A0A1G2DV03_9BACT|nr:MAG: hypothetical protein A2Z78_01620 [Candidatus Nealsonbacteria bacterium RBG_13_36_15]